MKRALFSLAFWPALTAISPAFAWGQTGHRVTGAIAEHYLTKKARKEIRKILGDESLAEASTWPDFMRSSADPFWRNEADAYHYVTIPERKTYGEVGAPPEGDAITALAKFTRVLKDPAASRDEKALALRFTVHIIGDLHQPLHAGNGTDRGGNDVKVTYMGQPTNLHAVWDSGLIDSENLSYTEWANWLEEKITKADRKAWSSVDPIVWAEESAAIRDKIYPGSANLGFQYRFDNIATVRRRLSQAGVRIADYLNDMFR